jgi:hypothetical protein
MVRVLGVKVRRAQLDPVFAYSKSTVLYDGGLLFKRSPFFCVPELAQPLEFRPLLPRRFDQSCSGTITKSNSVCRQRK